MQNINIVIYFKLVKNIMEYYSWGSLQVMH